MEPAEAKIDDYTSTTKHNNGNKGDDRPCFVYTGGRCPDKSITHVKIDRDVRCIERAAFAGCKKLKYVEFEDDGKDGTSGTVSVTTIEYAAFAGCHLLQYMKIPATVKKIGDYVFRDCFQMKRVDFSSLPSSTIGPNQDEDDNDDITSSVLEEIGEGAFIHCRSLTSIDRLPDSMRRIGVGAFFQCASLSGHIDLPPLLEEISTSTFNGCSSLESVRIFPATAVLKKIDVMAFENCSKLKSINFPDCIETIGPGAFQECSELSEISLPKNLKVVECAAFRNCGLQMVYINHGLEVISEQAFAECFNLSAVLTLEESPHLTQTEISTDTLSLTAAGNESKTDQHGTVKVIGMHAFYDCERLMTIDFLGGVEEIGDYAFNRCRALTGVSIPASIQKLGEGSFESCTLLSTVILPQTLEVIPTRAFFLCKALRSIDIPPSVKTIGKGAFSACSSLSSVNFVRSYDTNTTSSLQEIQGRAFFYCTSLETIELPDSLTTIEDTAFGICAKLHTVRLGNRIENICECVFLHADVFPLQEIKFSTYPVWLPTVGGDISATRTTTTVKDELEEEKRKGLIRIRVYDQTPSEIARRIHLYRFLCDFNRGGGQFLQRQQQQHQGRQCRHGGEEKETANDGKNDNDNKKYSPSLWPLILTRLLTKLELPLYTFFERACNDRLKNENISFDEKNTTMKNSDIGRRRAGVAYQLLLQGIAADLGR